MKSFAFKHEKKKSAFLFFIKTEYQTDKNRNGEFYFCLTHKSIYTSIHRILEYENFNISSIYWKANYKLMKNFFYLLNCLLLTHFAFAVAEVFTKYQYD